jgi:hypothetical protein
VNRLLPRLGLVTVLAVALAAPAATVTAAPVDPLAAARHQTLSWVGDTWRSMTAMVEPSTGLPADNIDGTLAAATRSRYTSPTNIGAYLWSTVVAGRLGLIGHREEVTRARATLASLATLTRHGPSGMFYNWYDPKTRALLRTWPVDGSVVYPFLSSVDNGWLASALMVVRNAIPELRGQADALLGPMDFAFYYDPVARGADVPVGLFRGGFWDAAPPGCSVVGNYVHRGPDVWFTCHTYGNFASETRIISYVAISRGQVPPAQYFAGWRTFPDTCDWGWQESKPAGQFVNYAGVPVFEGSYTYRGLTFVPTWGGDMFEEFMPNLFVPEERWGPDSWGRNHPVYVRGQIEHGLNDAKYGYWGFSPSSDPAGGYREYGVDAMGLDTDGYTSDEQRTSVDPGFAGCRDAKPAPTSYGDGVVTPHAVFLALRFQPVSALTELAKLRRDFDSYGPGGYYDAIGVRSGTVAKRYLALDQGMVLAALGNILGGDVLRQAFTRGGAERLLRPVMAMEEFNVPEHQ